MTGEDLSVRITVAVNTDNALYIKGLKDIRGNKKSRVITVDLKNQITECFQHNMALGHLILHNLKNMIESIITWA